MKVAFFGVGNMGSPMAANIVKGGHELFVYDSNSERAATVARQIGGRQMHQMSELAQIDFIVTMLPDGKVVRTVATGPNGIAQFAKPARC